MPENVYAVVTALEEIKAILYAENAKDLILAAKVRKDAKVILLIRGDGSVINAPFSIFTGKAKPDFDKMEIIDHGQTIRLGGYEASTDAILYELDEDYRKRRDANNA